MRTSICVSNHQSSPTKTKTFGSLEKRLISGLRKENYKSLEHLVVLASQEVRKSDDSASKTHRSRTEGVPTAKAKTAKQQKEDTTKARTCKPALQVQQVDPITCVLSGIQNHTGVGFQTGTVHAKQESSLRIQCPHDL